MPQLTASAIVVTGNRNPTEQAITRARAFATAVAEAGHTVTCHQPLTTPGRLNRRRWRRCLAGQRGAAEGDDRKYLGPNRDFFTHASPLESARLVSALLEDEDENEDEDGLYEDNDGTYKLTPEGRAFYWEHLAGLPPNTVCKSLYWSRMPEISSALAALADECRRRILGGDA
ncbi:hypothetical protein ACFYTG_41210 [Streptomyces mirabilis]|uniref:hypothetical protein n=1 Tax=Streptomyces mirabilis TaxID=68239 RepID=UPI0036745E7C